MVWEVKLMVEFIIGYMMGTIVTFYSYRMCLEDGRKK